ncbi:hypothetical protein DITRI_Ditri02bG0151300 [Diplodiscus trichospermus]
MGLLQIPIPCLKIKACIRLTWKEMGKTARRPVKGVRHCKALQREKGGGRLLRRLKSWESLYLVGIR